MLEIHVYVLLRVLSPHYSPCSRPWQSVQQSVQQVSNDQGLSGLQVTFLGLLSHTPMIQTRNLNPREDAALPVARTGLQ